MLEMLHQALLNVLGRQLAGTWTLPLPPGGLNTLGHVGLVRTEGSGGWRGGLFASSLYWNRLESIPDTFLLSL